MALEDKKEEKVEVSQKFLQQIQEQMSDMDKKMADMEAKNAGLEDMVKASSSTEGGQKIRDKKNFEPKFRTVRIRKYPIAGDVDNLGYVLGWTKRGAYQEVDRSGVSPQIVDYIDVIFHGQPKKAERIKLLDLLNKGQQIHCKVIEVKNTPRREPTGEEIDITVFDPAHGLVATGDKIDGWTGFSDLVYKITIPGIAEVIEINGEFVN